MIDPLALYASGIDLSTYVGQVAPLVRQASPQVGDLLDVGAGAGQLGGELRERDRRWTAIEPSPGMQARLLAHAEPPLLLRSGWADAALPPAGHDTVLAANVAAPLSSPMTFLDRCRLWARRSIVWVVPAQHGPRGLCLAGCLPAAWHGEDETPGIDIVLAGLGPDRQPDSVRQADWVFSLVVPDLPQIAAYLADRLAWPDDDPRRPDLLAHLTATATPVAGGARLDVPRRSAVLTWRVR